ncbi:galactokinase family protein [Duncaniella dubosii]|uniref:galactokinase family protein n=1 Tax=Duncaniella dubosii TaxID=2518971 RepID=UPI003F67DD8B
MELKNKSSEAFASHFGAKEFYTSAGRINYGEHTDYNGGFVFPGAIDKVIMAESVQTERESHLYSVDSTTVPRSGLNEADDLAAVGTLHLRVCREDIKRGGSVKGFDAVFAGNVPLAQACHRRPTRIMFCIRDQRPVHDNKSTNSSSKNRPVHRTQILCVNCGSWTSSHPFGKKTAHPSRLRSLEYEYFPFKIDG